MQAGWQGAQRIKGSLRRADRQTIITHIIAPRVLGNRAATGTSTPAVIDRPYLTCREVILAGMRRAAGVRRDAGRKAKDAAESSWDSEGGAIDQGK